MRKLVMIALLFASTLAMADNAETNPALRKQNIYEKAYSISEKAHTLQKALVDKIKAMPRSREEGIALKDGIKDGWLKKKSTDKSI